jgi:hypothetical protein
MHGMDSMEDPSHPWAVCAPTSLQCGFISDRMSTSLVYKGRARFFSGSVLLALAPESTRLLCAYGGDGGTRGKTCEPPGLTKHCIPGCASNGEDYEFCNPGRTTNAGDFWCDGRPWKPQDLGKFLNRDKNSRQYNEFVVDGFYWNQHLPHSIEAIVIGEDGKAKASALHQKFLAAYPQLTAKDVPLVSFHPNNEDEPFVLE